MQSPAGNSSNSKINKFELFILFSNIAENLIKSYDIILSNLEPADVQNSPRRILAHGVAYATAAYVVSYFRILV
jgi:hypothetical protein